MKTMALRNIELADFIIDITNQDEAFNAAAKFHFNLSIPVLAHHENAKRYGQFANLTTEEMSMLREFLKDNLDVYEAAKQMADRHLANAKACLASGAV